MTRGRATSSAVLRGEEESRTLADCLAIDQPSLLEATLIRGGFSAHAQIAGSYLASQPAKGILGAMRSISQAIRMAADSHGKLDEIVDFLKTRATCDTARGWAAFIVGSSGQDLGEQLSAINLYANDSHFAVREWAWLAVRHLIHDKPLESLDHLLPWTRDPSPRIRRFASESTRPRGVWCKHLPEFVERPESAHDLLFALRDDASEYVWKSAANWLNDASKSRPEWVAQLCKSWESNMTPSRKKLIRHATRHLRKSEMRRGESRVKSS